MRTSVEDYGLGGGLIFCAANNDVEGIEKLLNDGAYIDYMRADATPLMMALMNERKEAFKVLIDNGAGVDIKNKFGWTPLHNAAKTEDSFYIEEIIKTEYEQDFAVQDKKGWTAIRAAIEYEQNANLELMVNSGLFNDTLNISDNDGVSPIIVAGKKQNQMAFEILLNNLSKDDINSQAKNIQLAVSDWGWGGDIFQKFCVTNKLVIDSVTSSDKDVVTDKQTELNDKSLNKETADKPSNPFGF